MMNNLTREKLLELRLPGMAAEFDRQLDTPAMAEIPFDQRVRNMVDHEITLRSNKKLTLMLKRAELPQNAAVEDVNYAAKRGLDKPAFLSVINMDWVRNGRNIVITGPTGTGKSWLACALAVQACRQHMPAHFIRVPLLLESLATARAIGGFTNRLELLKKFQLLVLDDWGIDSMSQRGQNDLFEVIQSRSGNLSTLITSQLPMTNWHQLFDSNTVGDAMMDRIIHSSYSFELSGESLRKNWKSEKSSTPKRAKVDT